MNEEGNSSFRLLPPWPTACHTGKGEMMGDLETSELQRRWSALIRHHRTELVLVTLTLVVAVFGAVYFIPTGKRHAAFTEFRPTDPSIQTAAPSDTIRLAMATPMLGTDPSTPKPAVVQNKEAAPAGGEKPAVVGTQPQQLPAGSKGVPSPSGTAGTTGTTAATAPASKPAATSAPSSPTAAPTTKAAPAATTSGFKFADSFSSGLGNWISVSTGGGGQQISSDNGNSVLELWTTTSDSRNYNRVISRGTYANPTITVRARTTQTLAAHPSADFSDSLVWSRRDGSNFYQLQCYSTGWDVGKVSNDTFTSLGWGENKKCPVGTWHTYKVQQTSSTFNVWIDGTLVRSYSDSSPFNTGTIGLGAVSSRVQWDDLTVS